MAKVDMHAVITNQVIALLEAGTVPWVKPWSIGGCTSMPRRSTGAFYQGINVLILWMKCTEMGYSCDQWLTYKQAAALGGQVVKGSKATRVVYYNKTIAKDENDKETIIPFLKSYSVFNASQIEGLPAQYDLEPAEPEVFENEIIEQAQNFVDGTGAEIKHGGNRAFYARKQDQVTMPELKHFHSSEAYFQTLNHELIHWSGAKARLDRTKGKRFGDNAYAFEELVADMGAAFLCARLNISPNMEQTAAYIQSWLKVLREDKKFIFRAASQASKAAEYLFDLNPQQNGQEAA